MLCQISLKIFGATLSSLFVTSARMSTFTRRTSAAAKSLEEAVHQRRLSKLSRDAELKELTARMKAKRETLMSEKHIVIPE
mmetsp:Transcript_65186/g.174836  ORF Transcript_65186/g.174836 Transcript_65186/m.174836 type:complete len:81 (+) Transcript_65186:2204-2446(+)